MFFVKKPTKQLAPKAIKNEKPKFPCPPFKIIRITASRNAATTTPIKTVKKDLLKKPKRKDNNPAILIIFPIKAPIA